MKISKRVTTITLTVIVIVTIVTVTSYTHSKRTVLNKDSITYRWYMSWVVIIAIIATILIISNWHHARSNHLRRYFLGIRLHYLDNKNKRKRRSTIGDCRHLLSRTHSICIITNRIVLMIITNCSLTTINCSLTIKTHTAAHIATSLH